MKNNKSTAGKIFLKSMVLTFCAVFLVLVGYFGAAFLFGYS